MAYYPVLLDWEAKRCLVAGGGNVALHKAELLCSSGADVTVVAPVICDGIRKLPVKIIERNVAADDVKGCFFVVDATGNAEAEQLLSSCCREEGIPFNSASRVDDGTAMFPAVIRKGRTVVAVSTVGASPAASVRIRDSLAQHVPDDLDDILDMMSQLRPLSRKHLYSQENRKKFLHGCLDIMLRKKRTLAEEEIAELLQGFINKEKEGIDQ